MGRVDVLFGQINLQKGYAGTSALMEHLMGCLSGRLQTGLSTKSTCGTKGYQSFVVAVQEPPVREGKIKGFLSSHRLFYDQSAQQPRAAIYASRNIKLWLIPEYTSGDVATCLWKLDDGKEIYLTSTYMDIQHRDVIPVELQGLMRMASLRNKDVLIMADTNAHSTMWGSPLGNARGERLEEFIFQHNLVVHNTGDQYTFSNRRAATIIDVTLGTPRLADNIEGWKVTNQVQGSDHRFICWNFTISHHKIIKLRKWKLGDWSLFQKELEETIPALPEFWTVAILEKNTRDLMKFINKALDKSCPRKRVYINSVQPNWWHTNLTELHKKVRRALSQFRLTRTDNDHDDLIQARRTFSHAIRKAKRSEWKKFCKEAGDQKKASLLNKIIRRKENKYLGILTKDGKSCQTAEASMEYLLGTHFPGSYTPDDANYPESTDERGCKVCNPAADFITVHRVKVALDSFGSLKAPGVDGFPPIVLKNLGPRALERLTHIYKASYLLGYVPYEWRRARVIFIPKEGKKDYSNPRSFRPITLSSFLVKGLERVLLWELNDTSLSSNPLSENQHAFRRGKSTETALSNMVEYIERALIKGEYALGVFLDIQGAFDNVKPESIVEGMRTKNIDSAMIKWYQHYLLNRQIEVDYEGVRMERKLTLGTPQGGVLSPLMWNLVFEDLLSKYEEGFVRICGFADDAALVTTGSNLRVLHSRMQKAINTALEWGRQNGLTFSPPKTVAVLFHRKIKIEQPPPILMGTEEVNYSDKVRYLGVTMDRQLGWKPHVKQKIQAAKGHLLKLKNAMGKLWGAPPKLTRWLYTGIVRPALTYGALVWHGACRDAYIIRELRKLNRLALMSLGHFRHSTPTAGLEVINHVMPLDLWINYEAISGYVRTQGKNMLKERDLYTKSLHLKGHRQRCREFLEQAGMMELVSDFKPPERVWQRSFKLNRASFEEGKPPSRHLTLNIYTDGSRVHDLTGCGVVIYEDEKVREELSHHLGQQFSVFQGEIFAVKKAADWLSDRQLKHNEIDIFVDSQAALKALVSHEVSSTLVGSTIDSLNEVGEHNYITLHWIKAHAGHPGNEKADEVAKQGALNPSLLSDELPNMPMSMVKKMLRDHFQHVWNERWQQGVDCRQTKQWFPAVDRSKSSRYLDLDRQMLSNMVQIITGHNYLKRHESLVNDNDDSICRLCLEEEETSFHIYAECPALGWARLRVLGNIYWANLQDLTTSQATSFFREATIGRLNGWGME